MKARDLMTPNPECVTPNDSVMTAAQLMRDINVGVLPVVDDPSSRRLQGIITDRDITVRHVAEGHGQECSVGDHMTHGELETVRPEDDQEEVLKLMGQEQVRRIPVVDDENRLVGIIAQADIATKLGPREAEMVEDVIEQISEPARPER